MTQVRTVVARRIRERFRPLFWLRKNAIARNVLQLVDREVWLTIPRVNFKVRGRLITHGTTFALGGYAQEIHPEALALACVSNLEIHSFWDVGANI
jgi:hypothetical protein